MPLLSVSANDARIVRISQPDGGGNGNDLSQSPDLSADGRHVVFHSHASNLVPGDTNNAADVFHVDRVTGTIQRLSVAASGAQQNGWSTVPVISADGTAVAFHSFGSALAPPTFVRQTYARDLTSGTTEAVSVSTAGAMGNGHSEFTRPSISADGRFVAFGSEATNLVPGDTNGFADIFVRDRLNGTTERVSVASDGSQGTGPTGSGAAVQAAISADGRYVAFPSRFTNLVAGDTNNREDVFVHDRDTGTTERVSLTHAGGQGADHSHSDIEISADGRFVIWGSWDSTLVPGDTNGTYDGFMRDREADTTVRITIGPDGQQGNDYSVPSDISADNRFVVFYSRASNFAANDANDEVDVFLRDVMAGTTEVISLNGSGMPGNGWSGGPRIGSDDSFIAFASGASDLAAGDTNGLDDVFVWSKDGDAFPTPTPTVTPTPTPQPPTPTPPETAPPPSETPTPTPQVSETPSPSQTPTPNPSPAELPDGPLVEANGTELSLDGAPYTFVGMNVYNANTRVHSCWYPFTQQELTDSFNEMGDEVDVIRAWFFQDFATVNGQRSWTAFDQTLAAAEATGKKVIVTLGNHWSHCDTEGEKTPEWYASGYTERHPDLPSSYRDYVAQVVSRYGHRSTILMWQLLNEAEIPLFTPQGHCDSAAAHPILKGWAADVSGLIKSIDPSHLVSIGTIGSGQCGAQYTDYKSLHDIATVDLCEFHDYGTEVMPGDQWNGLAFRIQQCGELGKPIFVGETGIIPDWLDSTVEARADLFRDKLTTQMGAGVVGEVLWAWNRFESLTVTYDIGPGDPVFDMLADIRHPQGPMEEGRFDVSFSGHYDYWYSRHDRCAFDDTQDPSSPCYHVGWQTLHVDARHVGEEGSAATGTFVHHEFHVDDPTETSDMTQVHGSVTCLVVRGPVAFVGVAIEGGYAYDDGARHAVYALADEGLYIAGDADDRNSWSFEWLGDGVLGHTTGNSASPSQTECEAVSLSLVSSDTDGSRLPQFLRPIDDDVVLQPIPSDPDADDDGVDDSIDTGAGTFTNGVTSGAITNAAGHTVSVVPEGADEVRITVTGTGTAKASFSVCGFTLRLAPGSEVVIGCGSITTQVVTGSAELVLGGGLATVTIPAGVTATLDERADGGFSITEVSGGSVSVVVDGVPNTVGPGQTLTLEAWDFIGFSAPVDNGGVLNVVKAGTGVPLKWRLLDASGAPVIDLTTAKVTVAALSCSAGSSADQLEESASGASGLQNLGNGYYQFTWKTPKSYANSCKTMRLDIGDGVLHTALFQFKK